MVFTRKNPRMLLAGLRRLRLLYFLYRVPPSKALRRHRLLGCSVGRSPAMGASWALLQRSWSSAAAPEGASAQECSASFDVWACHEPSLGYHVSTSVGVNFWFTHAFQRFAFHVPSLAVLYPGGFVSKTQQNLSLNKRTSLKTLL